MKYKNENVVEGHCKENNYYSSPNAFKMGAIQQYSSAFYYYDDDLDQEPVTSVDSISSHQTNVYSAILSTNISSSADQQPAGCCPLSSSTNQITKNLHHRLPVKNPFINSTTPMVTSSACFANRIPLPGELEANSNGSFDTDSLIRLRNLRERNRVRNVNDGFDRLRKHLPNQLEFKKDKRLSKVQTLKMAITYIRQLESILNSSKQMI